MSIWDQITAAAANEFADIGDAGAATRIVLRLLMAMLLGGVLGFERESRGKSAGIRTHMLVALGSALFILVPREGGASGVEVSRVIQGLLAGIGFLGAGAIVKGRPGENIEGITSAATIWMTAALGMAIALGHALTAILATALALTILHFVPVPNLNGNKPTPSNDKTPKTAQEKSEPDS